MDGLRRGMDYFRNAAKDADVFLLQRVPKEHKKEIESIIGARSFMLESTPEVGNLCLAIAKTKNGHSFSNIKSVPLPSYDKVMKFGEDDKFQGCTALRARLDGANIITFLPCYEQDNNESPYAIHDSDRKSDIQFLLNLYKDRPTIIAGDFHTVPGDRRDFGTTHILQQYNFKSYLDEYNTWHIPDHQNTNLDKLISNIDIDITDVIVYNKNIDTSIKGHLAISYTLEYDIEED